MLLASLQLPPSLLCLSKSAILTRHFCSHVSPVESKNEVQPETKTEPPTLSETKPDSKSDETAVNGNKSPKSNGTPNGVTSNGDVPKSEDTVNSSKPSTSEASDPKKIEEKPAVSGADTATKESPEKKEGDASQPSPKKRSDSEDVQMENATSVNGTKEATQEDKDKKSPAAPTSPPKKSDADVKDTEMSDKATDELTDKPASAPKPGQADETAALPTSEVDLGPASMSQLAIDSTEMDISPVETSIEVSMADVPSTKVAREREDDAADEPAPKRAKTEPKEDEQTATPAAATDTSAPASDSQATLLTLTLWEDPDMNNKKLTSYQRREIRKVIGRIKKTKHGGHFRDAVAKLWPALGESYLARIDRPMDLSEIDRNLRDPSTAYATMGGFKKDLALIFENTLSFNGPIHEVTASALHAIKAVWNDVLSIPDEEPIRQKATPKPKPLREHRAVVSNEAAVRRQSSGPVSSPVREAPEAKPKPVVQESSVDRRNSTATEGDRPKRTVRAPKPKDIDYTTKPSRKKLKPELQFCEEVLTELMHPKHGLLNTWFLDAVDAEGLNIPDYYSIIKKPMDLGKVSRLLSAGEISSLKDFDKTVRLIFNNCYSFNGPPDQGNPVSLTAKQLEDLYTAQLKGKDAWLVRYAKANAPVASSSNDSDDEDEDEDDEVDHASTSGADYSKEVQELTSKLDEESKKLNGLFATGANQSLIDIQKNFVEVVQSALYKAAQNLSESKAKQDKHVKKSSKSSKTKSSSNVSSKKATSSAPHHPKKSSGLKKQVPKKTLSPADKDLIASAINDLEYPHLDRAIDIIKRDTGQNVSTTFVYCFAMPLWAL